MITRLTMGMPEALCGEVAPVEITALAVVTDDEMRALFECGELPAQLVGRMKQYTGLGMERPGSGILSGYNAMLVVAESDDHGIAVCGETQPLFAGNFPHAKEWMNNRITQMADTICSLGVAPGGAVSDCVTIFRTQDILGCLVTEDNGIGEVLIAELQSCGQIEGVSFTERGMEINYDVRFSPPMQAVEQDFIREMRQLQDDIDESKTPEWLAHAWTLAARFSAVSGISKASTYPAVLKEFSRAFADVDRRFEDCASEIYNYKAGFLPRELEPAAQWVCDGGDIEGAYSLAERGLEIKDYGAPDDDEAPGMDME